MKAILTYQTMIDGKAKEVTRLFDTNTATKICDVKKGVVSFRNINENTLEVPSQKEVKKWIGENEPDKYIKYFGEVEEG